METNIENIFLSANSKNSRRLFLRHYLDKNNILVEFLTPADKSGKKKLLKKEVIDFSSTGLAFRSDLEEEIFLPGTILNRLRILSDNKCLFKSSAKIKHLYYSFSDSGEPYYKVGIEFLKRSTKDEHEGLQEKILDPEEIELNIIKSIKNVPKILIKLEGSSNSYSGIFQNLDQNKRIDIIPLEVSQRFNLIPSYAIIKIYYVLEGDTYSFQSVVINSAKNLLKITSPRLIKKLWRRTTLRYSPAKHELVKIRLKHPIIKDKLMEYPLLDLTPTGGSLETKQFNNLFIEGMIIPNLQLIIGDKTIKKITAEVKYVEWILTKQINSYKCGLKFSKIGKEGINFLLDYLFKKCFPRLEKSSQGELQEILDFYYNSGFIYKEKAEFLSPLKREITDTFIKLNHPQNKFHKNIIFKENGNIYATISALWAYEKTWLIQHLTTVRHPSKFISKQVTLATADFCSKNPELEYQKIYWRPQNKWAQRIFGRFARGINNRELSHQVLYNYLELRAEDYKNIGCAESIKVETLRKEDYKFIESFFISRKEMLLLRADSLLRSEINLSLLGRIYKERGLKRERKIFIASQRGKFSGLVLIEDSSLLLNLSGLLNCFKLYTLGSDDPAKEGEIKKALIKKAINYYQEQGRKQIICLAPGSDLSEYQAFGFRKKKEYWCWTFHKSLAQPYYNHVQNLYQKIEKKKKLILQ